MTPLAAAGSCRSITHPSTARPHATVITESRRQRLFDHALQLADALLDLAGVGGDKRGSDLELERHRRHAELAADRGAGTERFDRTRQIVESTSCLAEHPVQGDRRSPGRGQP